MANPDITLSGTWAPTFVLKHSPNPSWDSGSTYAYYGLWNISLSIWNDSTTEGESSHIKVDTTTNEWSDHGGDHPGSNVSRSGETITLRNQSGAIKATFTRPPLSTYSSGPTVTQTRTTHTGIIPSAANFTIRAPTGLSYDKIGTKKFRLKFYDQNAIATYNLTVTWTTATGTDNTVIQITSGSGDLQIDVEPNNIINGSITLSINTAVFAMTNFGMMEIGANIVFDTFTYYETGPYTASFSPTSGAIGETIGYTVTDTNPYPDNNSAFSIDHPSFTNIANGTLSLAVPTASNNAAFTSIEGLYTLTVNNSVIATANYGATTSNGGGKRRRYPIVSTNLFDRQKSIYSIGLTHKDETLF
jgi:hypothetical protein